MFPFPPSHACSGYTLSLQQGKWLSPTSIVSCVTLSGNTTSLSQTVTDVLELSSNLSRPPGARLAPTDAVCKSRVGIPSSCRFLLAVTILALICGFYPVLRALKEDFSFLTGGRGALPLEFMQPEKSISLVFAVTTHLAQNPSFQIMAPGEFPFHRTCISS